MPVVASVASDGIRFCIGIMVAGPRPLLPACSLASAVASTPAAFAGSIICTAIPVCAGVAGTGRGSLAVPANFATGEEAPCIGVFRSAKFAAEVPADSRRATSGAASLLGAAALCPAPLSFRGAGGGPNSLTGRALIRDVAGAAAVGLSAANAAAVDAELRTVPALGINASR